MTRRNGYYLKDNKHYPSVTTVSKTAESNFGLLRWAVGQGGMGLYMAEKAGNGPRTPDHAKEIAIAAYEQELDRTANYGSNAHLMVERFLLNQPLPEGFTPTREEETALDSIKSFLTQSSWKPLYIETEVFNVTDRYAGRLDMVVDIEDPALCHTYLKRNSYKPIPGKYIVDIKTGSFYKDSHGRQLSAYAYALMVDKDITIDGGCVIHCERENPEKISIHFFSKEELKEYYKGFMAAHNNWVINISPAWWKKEHNL